MADAATSDDDGPLIGIVTVSDRASRGEYEDRGGPAVADYFGRCIEGNFRTRRRLIEDDADSIARVLCELCDDGCDLVVTTGGTGPAPRDVTPEATEAICEKMMPGFGEQMRAASLKHVPTAILSRQTAGIRGATLIINLPGKPKAIAECLDAVMPAVPYCIDLIGGRTMRTDPKVVDAFRPKT